MITEDTQVTPCKIDLRGKSLEEVVETLRANGYSVSASETRMWELHDKQHYGPDYVSPAVHVVWMKWQEAASLTCTIYNGKEVTLKPGHDLHLMDRPPGQTGQDWCVVTSGHIMA
jgi:hypothetical protein